MKSLTYRKPVITILMSVYNGESWLQIALESVMQQTFSDFEFIIINDGSTDRSLEIIERMAASDSRIQLVDKSNSGLTQSLNLGIKVANGEWIARIDADDIWKPTKLQTQYELAQKDPSLVLIGTGSELIDGGGNILKNFLYPASNPRLLSNLTLAGPCFAHSSAIYRTATARQLGGYRSRFKFAQDRDLWLRLSEVGKIASIPHALVSIRLHPAQITNLDFGRRQLIDSRVALTSYWIRKLKYFDPVGSEISEEYFQEFRLYVINFLARKSQFEYNIYIAKIKLLNSSNLNLYKRVISLFPAILNQPQFALYYIWKKIFGESFSKKIALDWVHLKLRI
jgi:glycosyltransferase involved in cell wall biosynthesis